MAEEKEQAGEVEFKPFSITDPTTPDFYANMTHVTVSRSDITIFFGRQLEEIEGSTRTTLPVARVTLTHDHFIRMVQYWGLFRDFLEKIYGEQLPSLNTVQDQYPDRFKEAIALLKQPTSEQM